MEHETPRQLPKSDWEIFDSVLSEKNIPRQVKRMMKTDWVILAEICQEKDVDMKIIIRPELWRDDVSSTMRARTLQEAHRRGITVQGLRRLCPMSERGIRKIVANGEANERRD